MKNKSLSFSLSWKIFLAVVVCITLTSILSIFNASKTTRETFQANTKEYTKTISTHLLNLNSVLMQQLRSYTILDQVGRSSFDPYEIQEMLIDYSGGRYKWFKTIGYVQYSTGNVYFDDGTVYNVESTSWFNVMKNQRTAGKGRQFYGDAFGTNFEDAMYPICKDAEPKDENGFCYGFFVGYVPINYMNSFVEKLKGGAVDSELGYCFLTNDSYKYLCHPNKELILKRTLLTDAYTEVDEKLLSFINSPNKKGVINGKIKIKEKEYTAYTSPIAGTAWTVSIAIPDSTIDSSSNVLEKTLGGLNFLAVFVIISILFVLCFVSFKPLKKLNNEMIKIASGDIDLTKRLPSTKMNEIGRVTENFNQFIGNLQGTMTDISNSKDTLTKANDEVNRDLSLTQDSIEEMESSVNEVSIQISNQSSAIQSTNDELETLSKKIENLGDVVNTQNVCVEEASTAVEEMIGNIKAVSQSTENMSRSFMEMSNLSVKGNETSMRIRSGIEEIASQSEVLGDANKIIADIAAQTNLLAMNAAIEAAHAGDVGKGFAVVADEIRKLSENSAKQSKNIKEQIDKIVALIEKVVSATAEAQVVNQDSAKKMNDTSELVLLIKNAMDEQSAGSQQVLESLNEMKNSSLEVSDAEHKMQESRRTLESITKSLRESSVLSETAVSKATKATRDVSSLKRNLLASTKTVNDSISQISYKINGFKY